MLFTKLCSYTFRLHKGPICIVFISPERPYPEYALTFEDLTHLDALGLIRFDMTAGFCFQDLPKTISLKYFDAEIAIEFPDIDKWDFMQPANSDGPKRYRLQAGTAFFTRAGIELSGVCGATASQDALNSVLKYWIEEEGYALWSPLIRSNASEGHFPKP